MFGVYSCPWLHKILLSREYFWGTSNLRKFSIVLAIETQYFLSKFSLQKCGQTKESIGSSFSHIPSPTPIHDDLFWGKSHIYPVCGCYTGMWHIYIADGATTTAPHTSRKYQIVWQLQAVGGLCNKGGNYSRKAESHTIDSLQTTAFSWIFQHQPVFVWIKQCCHLCFARLYTDEGQY